MNKRTGSCCTGPGEQGCDHKGFSLDLEEHAQLISCSAGHRRQNQKHDFAEPNRANANGKLGLHVLKPKPSPKL